jgi:hypothetical protein
MCAAMCYCHVLAGHCTSRYWPSSAANGRHHQWAVAALDDQTPRLGQDSAGTQANQEVHRVTLAHGAPSVYRQDFVGK